MAQRVHIDPDPKKGTMPAIDADHEQNCLSVLRALLGRPRKLKKVGQITGLASDELQAALRELQRRDLISACGNGYWRVSQLECHVCSSRPASGQIVIFDPETRSWSCEKCWEDDVADLERLFDAS